MHRGSPRRGRACQPTIRVAVPREARAARLSGLPDGVSVEPGRMTRSAGPLSSTVTLFGSHITDPVQVDRSAYVLRNLPEPTTTVGMELLGTLRQAPLAITASYTYVRSRELVEGVADDVALTPRHSIGLVTMVENEDGRIGLEVYYTGRQRLEDNPYREMGESYVIVGLLIERRVGRSRLTMAEQAERPRRQGDGRERHQGC